jgi:hypothetical protein
MTCSSSYKSWSTAAPRRDESREFLVFAIFHPLNSSNVSLYISLGFFVIICSLLEREKRNNFSLLRERKRIMSEIKRLRDKGGYLSTSSGLH